jgi:MinD superfamily P-loop ATPase
VPWELPVVDETRCTGCGDCVRLCPTNCLGLAGHVPWLTRPAACICCALCVLACPSQALTLAPPYQPLHRASSCSAGKPS